MSIRTLSPKGGCGWGVPHQLEKGTSASDDAESRRGMNKLNPPKITSYLPVTGCDSVDNPVKILNLYYKNIQCFCFWFPL